MAHPSQIMAAWAVAALALLPFAIAQPQSLRGVNPELLAQYQGSNFKCLDGSKSIPIDRVNDDFCDCGDGSDEPGEQQH